MADATNKEKIAFEKANNDAIQARELDKLKGLKPSDKVVIEWEQVLALNNNKLEETRPKKRNVLTLFGASNVTYYGVPEAKVLGIYAGEKDGEILYNEIKVNKK